MRKTRNTVKIGGLSVHLTSAEQMYDAYLTALLLTVSGGFQDAYTYCFRGQVFANAQTGNIVLLSANLLYGQWTRVLHYLIPLTAFVLGTCAAELIRIRFKEARKLHWRQTVLLLEILTLFAVGFIPSDNLANAMVSFVSAVQVQSFRKMHGKSYASTMCIGNLRSGTELICSYFRTHEKKLLESALRYGGVLLCFAFGAGLGSAASVNLGEKAIFISCAILVAAFLLLFLTPIVADDTHE